MYWIYDIPNALLCLLVVGSFVAFTAAGVVISRPFVRRLKVETGEHNSLVGNFLSAYGVFYGLAIGLIAVATWESYSSIEKLVSAEAAELGTLYVCMEGFPEPRRTEMQRGLRGFLDFVINEAWPAQQHGGRPLGGERRVRQIHRQLVDFRPEGPQQEAAHAEALGQFSRAYQARRLRLESVNSGLPAALWAVVLVGALLNLVITFLFRAESLPLHLLLAALLATFIGMLVFLTAAMDNPYRGEFCVSSDAYRVIEDTLMDVKVAGVRATPAEALKRP